MAQQQPIEKRVDLLCFPSVPHHAFPCISVCVCSVYVPVLRYDLLLMTEEAAVGRTAEGKGGGAFQRKQRDGTGRPDLLGLLSVSLHPPELTRRLLFKILPPHPAQQLDPAYL